jgi:hypothetical protein
MELGAYGSDLQPLIQGALEQLSDESAMAQGTPEGPGRHAELLPGTDFSWVVLERPRLLIVWQIATRN